MTNILGIGTFVFSMNSLFDPNITTVGHQPLAFDQWSTLYGNYEVIASKIKIIPLTPDINMCKFAVYPSHTVTPIGDIDTAVEQPYSKNIYWTNNATLNVYNKPLVSYMSIKKFEGRTTASVNFSASTGSNPSSNRFWQLIVTSVTATDISDIVFQVEIVYYCRFFKRLALTTS